MATIQEAKPRSLKVYAEGEIVFNPAMGQLTTPPGRNYTGNLAVQVGNAALVMDRDEFLVFAKRVDAVRNMIGEAASEIKRVGRDRT